jgi:hypothetical protein
MVSPTLLPECVVAKVADIHDLGMPALVSVVCCTETVHTYFMMNLHIVILVK